MASYEMQDYEKSVSFLGTWGSFQRRVFFLLCLTSIPSGYNILSPIFLMASPLHHCHIPTHSNLKVFLSSLKQEDCKDGWTYSTEYYQSTVVTEFNLVCRDQWKQPLSSSIYFLGGLCGCFISGQVSDRFGRKPVLFGSITMLSIFSGAVAFAPSWPIFTVLFFMMGLCQLSSYIVVFVLGSEILTGSTRVLFSSLGLPLSYVIGTMLLLLTHFLPKYSKLILLYRIHSRACLSIRLVPESPRWLASCGRLQEAELVLRSAALENKVEPPQVIFIPAKNTEALSFLDLLRTKNMRYVTLILWFFLSISLFGVVFNISSLYGNPFLNYFLVVAVEIPAHAVSWLMARSCPRRVSFISFTLLGVLSVLLILTLHSLTLFLVLLGKFGIQGGTAVSYVYTGELSPTVIRNTEMSTCAMFSRLGSSISPYLLQLVVGSLSLLSVLLCVLLPETFRKPLPDTIQQITLPQWSVCTVVLYCLLSVQYLWPCSNIVLELV
uniref:Solute carrier family 22 member 5-like n=1 Tax=Mastacembelus armatus TaxID=205130 RepID=A0A7N8WSD7_9TELE